MIFLFGILYHPLHVSALNLLVRFRKQLRRFAVTLAMRFLSDFPGDRIELSSIRKMELFSHPGYEQGPAALSVELYG